MRKFLTNHLLMLVVVGLVPFAAQAEEITNFGDWGYNCEKSQDGSEELCFVFQNVTKKDSGELVLGARIAYRPGQEQPLLVVTVPLGTLLPAGAALTMDDIEPIKLAFFLCSAQGCTTAAQALTPEMVEAMKKGDKAVIRVAAPNQQVVGLPLSLNGFTKAMASLEK